MKGIVKIIKIKMMNLMIYWVLLTEFINFLSINFFSGEQSDESNLPKWVKVSKQRFDVIKTKVQNAKINNLQALILMNQTNYFMK